MKSDLKKKLLLLSISIVLYLGIKHFVPYGPLFLYPLILLVTFFHELGHALFAVLTGGTVHGIQINPNGSGHAQISGGFAALVIMGGYIGSAIFGNLLLFIGLAKEKWARFVPYFLAAALLFTALWWYQRFFTSVVLCAFAAGFVWLSKKNIKLVAAALVFLGSTSVLYIIEDINSGPLSDLAMFTQQIPILPQIVWTAFWLILVLIITYHTVKRSIGAPAINKRQ